MGFCLPSIGFVSESLQSSGMELSPVPWRFDQGFHDPGFVDQCDQIPPLCELISEEQMAAALGNDFCDSLSPESRASYSTLAPEERPAKLLKTGCWSSSDAARRRVLSFAGVGGGGGAAAVTVKPEEEVVGFSVSVGSDSSYETVKGKRSNSGRRSPTRSKDHTIAERRRREKLSQRFIALSAMVPGLKKMDKASVLGDAVSYVKKLQERVKTLEDQAAKKTVESTVPLKKSRPGADGGRSSADGNFEGPAMAGGLPEIDAVVSERRVLVRIHCERRRGALLKVLGEMEKLHLSILNTSVIPFAGSSFYITVMAQMEEECSMTANELVNHLNSAYRQLISSKTGRSSVQP